MSNTELLSNSINNRNKHGQLEAEALDALRNHDWKTSATLAFGFMKGPTLSVDGDLIVARTRQPDGGVELKHIIAFFETYLRKAEAAGATHFAIYLLKIVPEAGTIKYGLNVKYPNH